MQPTADKNIAVMCNSLAGAGRADLFAEKLATELSGNHIAYTVFTNNWPASLDGYTDVFIVGGDGTLNYFINHYQGIKLPLVIFNAGTGNDFHWLLYGNKNFEEQFQIALYNDPKPIDIGKCNEYFFINGVGVGFEGEVAKALTGKKKRPGKTSFLITILKRIFTYRSKQYFIRSAEKDLSGKKMLIDVSNGKRAGGGFNIAPESKADDGLFDIIIADALNSLQRLRYLPVIEKGKHLKLSFIHYYQSTKILIESDQTIQFHLDGEYFEATALKIEIIPAALNFRF